MLEWDIIQAVLFQNGTLFKELWQLFSVEQARKMILAHSTAQYHQKIYMPFWKVIVIASGYSKVLILE